MIFRSIRHPNPCTLAKEEKDGWTFVFVREHTDKLEVTFLFPSLSNSGSARGRWYKFNDNVVEEFDMNDETLEYECFGGEYRPKVYDQCV